MTVEIVHATGWLSFAIDRSMREKVVCQVFKSKNGTHGFEVFAQRERSIFGTFTAYTDENGHRVKEPAMKWDMVAIDTVSTVLIEKIPVLREAVLAYALGQGVKVEEGNKAE